MIVDTSAIVAAALGEPSAPAIRSALADSERTRIGAPTLVELQAVLEHHGDPRLSRDVDKILEAYDVEVVAFTAEHGEIARRAYQDYGRVSGHPARLNFGDCLSYAVAAALREPLLFVGDDFTHTDLDPAIQPG